MTTPEDAFHLLADLFTSRGNEVLDIDIIPSTLESPFIKHGTSIGVTKKYLVQAFTVARQLFIKRLMPMTSNDFDAEVSNSNQSTESKVPKHIITEIMLLFDSEHLTACNWRKKWLLAAISRYNETNQATSSSEKMLETELTLMQTYQGSPLSRHTKSPTLWSHRLWVLDVLTRMRRPTISTLLNLERAELDIVLRAGMLHPKNFYAFTYMRKLHSYIADVSKDQGNAGQMDRAAASLVDPTLTWCLSHPRDISGWMFAMYLLDQSEDADLRSGTVRRVLQFALKIGWEGESLWTFIDQATRQFGLESVISETFSDESDKIMSDETRPSRSLPKWPWRNRLSQAQAYWAAAASGARDDQP
ncbi:Protein prenyltransferase [Penicillium waksmanii]|uniref:Protein prenyltransferase n=1 Tax=Penicillium waksmanii TaxID=69791 RepID=UPI002547AC98|nr:Protein prenyltransferase [Penicillium waksmanii]KAJ6000320.1 Protein prenyltransferase [Penicillium waksmanii]